MENVTVLLIGKPENFINFNAGYHNLSLQRAWFTDDFENLTLTETREYWVLNPEVFFDLEEFIADALDNGFEILFRNFRVVT